MIEFYIFVHIFGEHLDFLQDLLVLLGILDKYTTSKLYVLHPKVQLCV